jgi:prepilin-type N-terminal cleavage/methylation domain-containing protein
MYSEIKKKKQRGFLRSISTLLDFIGIPTGKYQRDNSQLPTPNGFTLIELLVTIAIIGILSSVLLVNLSGFRERTRDVQRKRDLRTLQTALELYRADVSNYPANLPACGNPLANGGVTYLRKSPCDPLNKTDKYIYNETGATYTLIACLENASDSEKDTPKHNGCADASFTVTSP